MKLLRKIMIVLAIISAGTMFNEAKVLAQGAVSFQVFYDDLSPHGRWVPDPEFGYVWMPAVETGFSPYSTAGHWVLTDFGWTWVSDYPWGWAPFHYGRWRYNDYYGWQWIPGHEWGPAWVSWRRSRGYYGWAPLSPGISVNVAVGSHYHAPHHHWVFVNERYIGDRHVHRYYAPHKDNVTIIKNSTVINNTYIDKSRKSTYIAGPRSDEVQKVTGKPVRAVAVKENAKPGQSVNDKELSIYRPAVKNNDSKDNKVAPRKVTELKDVKTINGKQPPATKDDRRDVKGSEDQRDAQDKKQPGKIAPANNNTDAKKANDPRDIKPRDGGKGEQPAKRPHNVNKNPREQHRPGNIKRNDAPKPKDERKK